MYSTTTSQYKVSPPHGEVPPPHNGMCNVPNAGNFDTNPPPYYSAVQDLHNTITLHYTWMGKWEPMSQLWLHQDFLWLLAKLTILLEVVSSYTSGYHAKEFKGYGSRTTP